MVFLAKQAVVQFDGKEEQKYNQQKLNQIGNEWSPVPRHGSTFLSFLKGSQHGTLFRIVRLGSIDTDRSGAKDDMPMLLCESALASEEIAEC